jgi:hypothetical protein
MFPPSPAVQSLTLPSTLLAPRTARVHHPGVTADKIYAAVAPALAKEMTHLAKVLDWPCAPLSAIPRARA